MQSNIFGELRERYSNDGYYALAILVVVLGLFLWASFEASKVIEAWNTLEAGACLM